MERPDNETIERQIIDRFFEAIEYLKSTKKIKNLHTLCDEHDINYHNLMRLKYPDNTRKINNIVFYIICNVYGISLDYVIAGKGKISGVRTKRK